MTSCLESPAAVAHAALVADLAAELGVEVVLAATALHLASGRPDATAAVMETLESSGIAAIAQAAPGQLTAAVPPPGVGADAELLGAIRQAALAPTDRHDRGAVYTPRIVAERLCHIAMAEASPEALTVCDPAAGGGVFLLAAADALAASGGDPAAIVRNQLWAADVDTAALLATRLALALWSGVALPAEHTACADALTGGLEIWSDHPAEGFDLVIGNPPFQNQLGRGTARSATETAALRARLGPAATGYADTATLFVVAALMMTRPGGHAAMIVPQSFLVARDAAAARAELLAAADLCALWLATEMVFDSQVRVCAPILRRRASAPDSTDAGGVAAPVVRFTGASVAPAPPASPSTTSATLADAPTWGALTADLLGVPLVAIDDRGGHLGDLCRATAGFRDEYYGLRGAVTEARTDATETRPRLVTSGLIDPGRCLWGCRATKFGRARWEAPVVDVAALDPASATSRWGRARLVPKVLVATQTRVLEAVVDTAGDLWPSVPVISVEAPTDRLFDIVAVLLAPPVSAWAMAHFGGAALSADAIKLSARQVGQIPLPLDTGAWVDGAAAAKAVHEADTDEDWRQALVQLGEAMCRAYAVDSDGLLSWWTARLPPWR